MFISKYVGILIKDWEICEKKKLKNKKLGKKR